MTNDSTNNRHERFTIQGIGIADHERKRLYDLKTVDGFISIRDLLNELSEQADAVREELQLCEEENNALQERNDRQAETIRKLYTLIENKDWKGLTAHMEELYECEEQLKKEWRLYSD